MLQFDSSRSDIRQCITVHTSISYVLLPAKVRNSEICKEGNKSRIVNTILVGKLIVAEPRTNLLLHTPKAYGFGASVNSPD